MSNIRVVDAIGMNEGADAFVNRLFPVSYERMNFDPFVLWDHFELEGGMGFPPHPHRGFEGITYLLQGSMKHEDSLGNSSTVHAGGIQRFTAGAGIVHSETPAPTGQTSGLQIWVNLSQANKQVKPRYDAVQADQVPETQGDGWIAKHILGEQSAIDLYTNATLLDLCMDTSSRYQSQLTDKQNLLVYVLSGSAKINDKTLTSKQALLATEQTDINIQTNEETRLILAYGQAHREAILQRGPFVD